MSSHDTAAVSLPQLSADRALFHVRMLRESASLLHVAETQTASDPPADASEKAAVAATLPTASPLGPSSTALMNRALTALLDYTQQEADCVMLCRGDVGDELAAGLVSVADAVRLSRQDGFAQNAGNGSLAEVASTCLLSLTLVTNLCTYSSCRSTLKPLQIVEPVIAALQRFPKRRRLVHLGLMAASNVAHCEGLVIRADTMESLVCAPFLLYDEVPVIEAWLTALMNFSATARENRITMVTRCNLISHLERLLEFHGHEQRLVAKGVKFLVTLASVHLPGWVHPRSQGLLRGATSPRAPS